MGRTRAALAIGTFSVGVLSCGTVVAQERAVRTVLAPVVPAHAAVASGRAKTGEADIPPIEIRLVSQAAFSPAHVRGLVRVAPHSDNRMFRIEMDSPGFYRSSDIQLDGERAARNHFFTWQSLPPGPYAIVVTVFGPGGDVRAERHVPLTILGPGMDALP